MRKTLAPLLLGLALATGCAQTGGPDHAERARDLARDLIIVDTHIDVPYRLIEAPADIAARTATGDFDWPRARAGGLDGAFMSIYIPAETDARGEASVLADTLIDNVEAIAAAQPDKFVIATCPADVRAAAASGRVALPLGMENGGPIAGDIARLDHYRDRGIAYVGLTHSKSNHISDSSYDSNEPWGGLSPFGRTLVPELQARGIMVDVSHVSDRAFWQIVELAQAPIIASHSSLRHFTPGFARNLDDAMVQAIAGTGGVVQIAFGSGFLTRPARAWGDAQRAAITTYVTAEKLTTDDPAIEAFVAGWRKDNPYPYASIDDLLDHIDRAVKLAGIDHVGIGSDFDGVGDTLPVGLKDVSAFPALVEGLLRRGYSEADIEKILGGNLLRVWSTVRDYGASKAGTVACRG
ncbi:MAG: dipeptidase [Pseudomonadales bacterium]